MRMNIVITNIPSIIVNERIINKLKQINKKNVRIEPKRNMISIVIL